MRITITIIIIVITDVKGNEHTMDNGFVGGSTVGPTVSFTHIFFAMLIISLIPYGRYFWAEQCPID